MKTRRLQKRRAVLLNADVVGYSTMMARDAAGTIDALLSNTRWLARAVEAFDGRVVDAPGDNLLAEFPGEAAAVRCAMYVQWHEGKRNRGLPEHLRIRFRIGIHAGEVFAGGGRLYGSPVNVAARLQASAQAGGILLSDLVAERCRKRGTGGTAVVDLLSTREPTMRKLKNIPEPVTTVAISV